MASRTSANRWWWTSVLVPLIGSGGLVTILVTTIKSGGGGSPSNDPSKQTIQTHDVHGNIIQSGGSVNYHEAPKPLPKPPIPFNEIVTMTGERDVKVLHGVTIKTGSIGMDDSGMFAHVIIARGSQELRSDLVRIGTIFEVPREGNNQLRITVKEIKLVPPPDMTLADLAKLGIVAEALIKRIVVLIAEGQDEAF